MYFRRYIETKESDDLGSSLSSYIIMIFKISFRCEASMLWYEFSCKHGKCIELLKKIVKTVESHTKMIKNPKDL